MIATMLLAMFAMAGAQGAVDDPAEQDDAT